MFSISPKLDAKQTLAPQVNIDHHENSGITGSIKNKINSMNPQLHGGGVDTRATESDMQSPTKLHNTFTKKILCYRSPCIFQRAPVIKLPPAEKVVADA